MQVLSDFFRLEGNYGSYLTLQQKSQQYRADEKRREDEKYGQKKAEQRKKVRQRYLESKRIGAGKTSWVGGTDLKSNIVHNTIQ